ncbi:family 78 glycoside hydrolase catalytic domain [Paenibacillus chartarius]|uniref:alpha-L-rhamnosidase n=1 Tax=Paenibacillus chartarius TaxID=747481 RepID=A0ABV6DK34_9BACL
MLVSEMFVDGRDRPLGVDAERPAFGWSFAPSAERGQVQTAYRILVSDNEERLLGEGGSVWDSGRQTGCSHAHVLYEGPPLRPKTRYYWSIQLWDQEGRMSESAVSWWETGMLGETGGWSASWMAAPEADAGERIVPLPLFRHEFLLDDKPVAKARAYICGLGHYELRMNGSKIGDGVLEPGWTRYDKTCLYNVYDVTGRLHPGANAVGVMLGNGFYNVTGGRYTKFKRSFGRPKCLIQLEIEYADGTVRTVASGTDWRTAPGPIVFSCIYGGEDYDARCEQDGWDRPGFREDARWVHAEEAAPPAGKLKAQALPALKVMKRFRPAAWTQPAPGVFVADLGVNFSGWVEIEVSGPPGAVITLTPAELLKDNGKANQKWSGSPYRFTYVLGDGEGTEVWSPRFSYYGFRYVQIEGAVPVGVFESDSDDAQLIRLDGCMIYPDMPAFGSFACSDPLLNRIHEIINQAILSNTKSIFTDCPHREKLGWLEQVYLMGPSVAFNYDVQPLLMKTMEDIRDAQLPDGMVPTTAPEFVVFAEELRCFRDSVSWGAAYVLTGWNLLRMYGNRRILEEHYEGMKAYVDYVTAASDGFIVRSGLGDWYDAGERPPGYAQLTPVAHTETAVYCHMVDIFSQIAGLLGRTDDASKYGELRESIKAAFNVEFFDRTTGLYATGSQTSQAMPLALELVADRDKEAVLARLIDNIVRHGYHTTAGDIGHRFVLLALARSGRSDLIYEMAGQSGHPSYGYQIAHGATSLTEAWDGPTVGKSQNHFMLGHIEEWFYTGLAGLDGGYDPGSGEYLITLQPAFPPGLSEVRAERRIPAGRVAAAWKRFGDHRLELEADIPANCTAVIRLPAPSPDTITESGSALGSAFGVKLSGYEDGWAIVHVGSGRYRFESALREVTV